MTHDTTAPWHPACSTIPNPSIWQDHPNKPTKIFPQRQNNNIAVSICTPTYHLILLSPSVLCFVDGKMKIMFEDNIAAANLMTPSKYYPFLCNKHIAATKVMVHSSIWYALSFFSKARKKEINIWWEKIHNARKKKWLQWDHPDVTTLKLPSRCYHPDATIQMLASQHYHQSTTILMIQSQCYCPHASISMPPSKHYHLDTTILMLPSKHYHLDTTVPMLPSQSCSPDAILLHPKNWFTKP